MEISHNYAGIQPVMMGILKDVLCFMGDLMRQISLPLALEFRIASHFGTNGMESVKITKDLEAPFMARMSWWWRMSLIPEWA